jgi:hypothetical protein
MEGQITVTYVILCDDDVDIDVDLQTMLENEKVQKLLKSEFAKGARNLVIDASDASGSVNLSKEKKLHTVVIEKNDFADALSLAEEDARSKKLLKGKCNRIELVDLCTVSGKRKEEREKGKEGNG